ncbi:hypothetical protein P691DRAFT_687221, partial [Macrolepiota fuliginosa MF-IS2]
MSGEVWLVSGEGFVSLLGTATVHPFCSRYVSLQINLDLKKKKKRFGERNLMIWGCMLWDGVGYATRIDGKMDADLYVQILEDELQQSLGYY